LQLGAHEAADAYDLHYRIKDKIYLQQPQAQQQQLQLSQTLGQTDDANSSKQQQQQCDHLKVTACVVVVDFCMYCLLAVAIDTKLVYSRANDTLANDC
jgi:hypothetical protein